MWLLGYLGWLLGCCYVVGKVYKVVTRCCCAVARVHRVVATKTCYAVANIITISPVNWNVRSLKTHCTTKTREH